MSVERWEWPFKENDWAPPNTQSGNVHGMSLLIYGLACEYFVSVDYSSNAHVSPRSTSTAGLVYSVQLCALGARVVVVGVEDVEAPAAAQQELVERRPLCMSSSEACTSPSRCASPTK